MDENLLCWIHNKLQLFLLRFLQWCDFEALHRLDNFRHETVGVLLSKAPAYKAAIGEHKHLTIPPSWEPPGIYKFAGTAGRAESAESIPLGCGEGEHGLDVTTRRARVGANGKRVRR